MKSLPWRRRASRDRLEAELDEELGFHLGMTRRELVAGGDSPDEAEAGARARFGDVAQVRRECLQIATGEQTMIKNILLAASLAVILVLSLVCVHFFRVARAAKQEAIMQRLLAEQEMQRAQSALDMLQNVFLDVHPARVQAAVELSPLLAAANLSASRSITMPAEVQVQLRAAATQAAQDENE